MSWSVIHSGVNGGNLGEHTPLNLEYGFRLSSIGYMNHVLPAKHIIHGGTHLATVEPYATDFLLKRDNVKMMGGLVVAADSSQDSELVQLAGLDWRHYLERRIYPFDPADPTKYFYAVVQEDVFTIAETILTTTLSQNNSLELLYSNGLSGVDINYRIDPGDTENLYEKINSLAEGEPGFDHEVTPDRQLIFYSPRKSVECDLVLEQGKNIRSIAVANKGIKATQVLGLGSGTSKKAAILAKRVDLEAKYRRHDSSEDFGDISDPVHLHHLTQGQLEMNLRPQLDLTVELAPSHTDEFWSLTEIGCIIPIRGNTGYEVINDIYRLIAIDGSVNNQGGETLTLEFEIAET